MTPRDAFADELPRVAEAEALDDQSWFDEHPGRRFRGRRGSEGFFLDHPQTRRRPAADRNASTSDAPEDVDRELAGVFFCAAYPGAPVAEVQRRARKVPSRRMMPFGDAVEILQKAGVDRGGR
jgi:hypothetical protein